MYFYSILCRQIAVNVSHWAFKCILMYRVKLGAQHQTACPQEIVLILDKEETQSSRFPLQSPDACLMTFKLISNSELKRLNRRIKANHKAAQSPSKQVNMI